MRYLLLVSFCVFWCSLPLGCADNGTIDNDPIEPPVITAPPAPGVQETPARPDSPRPREEPATEQ